MEEQIERRRRVGYEAKLLDAVAAASGSSSLEAEPKAERAKGRSAGRDTERGTRMDKVDRQGNKGTGVCLAGFDGDL